MQQYEVIRLLAVNARLAYLNSYTNKTNHLYDNPKVGDIVLEVTRAVYTLTEQFPGKYDKEIQQAVYIGKLISLSGEPPMNQTHLIESLTNPPVQVSWQNARFIKVMTTKEE